MPDFKFVYLKICAHPRLLIFLVFIFLSVNGNLIFAQNLIAEDSIPEEKIDLAKLDSAYHNPHKAALFSAVVPGLGQIYNKKYWKVPIIYVGFASLGYLIQKNSKQYKQWRQAYIDYPDYKLDVTYDLTLEQIELGKDFYKRQKELSIIGAVGLYIIQILDATVDGYLFDWSVNDDLSLRIEPSILTVPDYSFSKSNSTFGLSACLSF